jgi:DNA-binding transcriptional MerR regulator
LIDLAEHFSQFQSLVCSAPKLPIANTMDETYSITQLAREFELTPRAIRYWEDQGLVAPRREGQTRVYGKRDRTRLKLALRGKRLGLSLAEIRELIDMYDSTGSEAAQLQRFLDALARRRAALEQQRTDLAALLGEITRFEKQCQKLLADSSAASSFQAQPAGKNE